LLSLFLFRRCRFLFVFRSRLLLYFIANLIIVYSVFAQRLPLALSRPLLATASLLLSLCMSATASLSFALFLFRFRLLLHFITKLIIVYNVFAK
jgi:hypothetical protein